MNPKQINPFKWKTMTFYVPPAGASQDYIYFKIKDDFS
jgi:hypothetical protein